MSERDAADLAEFLSEMLETALSDRDVDVVKLRADLGVVKLEGLDPRAMYERALRDADRPETWPPAPTYADVAPE